MLKPFYNYLASKIDQFFSQDLYLRAGDRYNFYIEDKTRVEELYDALGNNNYYDISSFQYQHDDKNSLFETIAINYNGKKLIVVSDLIATENFITLLRNKVAAQKDKFVNTAILILIHSELDSLKGGSESLSKKGMPLNFESFSQTLKVEIRDANLQKSQKIVLQESLNKVVNENAADAKSIFDLSSIVSVLFEGSFTTNEFPKLKLFPHKELETISDDKKIKNYIEDNYKWFERIQLAIQHGDLERDLENILSPNGIRNIIIGLENDNWQQIDFSDILRWSDKKSKTPINLERFDVADALGIESWSTKDGDTKSQSRKQNLVIFNPSNIYPLEVNIEFDKRFNGPVIQNNGNALEINVINKKIQCLINECAYNGGFIKFECSDPEVKSNKFLFKIWVLPFSSELLYDLQGRFSINAKTGSLSFSSESHFVLNKNISVVDTPEKTIKANCDVDLDCDARCKLLLDYEEEDNVIPFEINYRGYKLKLEWLNEIPTIKSISGWDIWQNKRVGASSFQFENEDNKIKLYNKGEAFTVRDEYRNSLLLEEKIMGVKSHSWIENESKHISPNDLSNFLSPSLIKSFENYYSYFDKGSQLPSLTWLDNLGIKLAEIYINEFCAELDKFNDGTAVNEDHSLSLFSLGAVIEDYEERKIKFSPLHPIMVMYQLHFNSEIKSKKLYQSLLKKMVPGNLVPFFKWPTNERNSEPIIYAAKDNDHSPEWQYYSKDYKFKQLASKSFIRKLVKTKISDFSKHLKFLFEFNHSTPLKINAVNLGDCKQVLQGIFDYYKECLNKGVEMENLRPIEVFIYGSSNHVTKFEEFSHIDSSDVIQQQFDIDFKSTKHDIKELINFFRRNVHYYIREDLNRSEYAHLSFFQFNSEQVGICDLTMDHLNTGKSLGGLITDVPSFFDDTAYKTGYGTRFDSDESNFSTSIKRYNALARIVGTTNPYNTNLAIGTSIKKDVRNDLDGLYKHSQWVTFIDPRFDLSFFKNEKSIVIIHYSDQFSNASGYDAITVTQKSEQYKAVLNDFLDRQKISKEHINQDVNALIDLFNAINGEWLLGILSERKNENIKNEKISLISAIKVFMAIHDRPEITWIPISLEEILRVSGGAGFSSTEGLFSTKNLGEKGAHSDDILMVGLYEKDEKLKMCFYPLEVKIGINSSSVEKKAKEQAKKTTELLSKYLLPEEDCFSSQLYRSFFAKLCIINSEKLDLYQIWPEKNWKVVSENYREKLLNDDFIICNEVSSTIGKCGNLFFTKDTTGVLERQAYMDESDIMSLTLFESDAFNFILNTIPAIKESLIETKNTIDKRRMLSSSGIAQQEPAKPIVKMDVQEENLKIASDIKEEYYPANAKEVSFELLKFDKITFEERKGIYRTLLEKFKALKVDMMQRHIDEVEFIEGPAFYRMALYPTPSTTINKIESVKNELNLVLGLSHEQSVRIFNDLGVVWLEVPKGKEQRVTVTTEHIWSSFTIDGDFRIPFGVDISGDVISVDFSSSNSPHLLMAGTTGSGKSVVLDTLIRSAARFYSPEELNMFLIDPKGNELIDFEDLEHVTEDNGETSEDAIELLNRGVDEMQRRYQLFKGQKSLIGKAAKNISDYNQNTEDKLPRWIIVLDEYADLIEEDLDNKKEIERLLKRLSQKARAAGIHVILATQKPLASIVSSSIKANLPGVLALKVKTSNDSRVIIDEGGAETLAGYGDALFKDGAGKVVRVQCAIHLN